MKIIKTHKELADKIINVINKDYNLNLSTIDNFSMRELIINIIKEARFWRQPEYFWEIDNGHYDTILIYQDGKTEDCIIASEEINIDEGNLTREGAIQNIINKWKAQKIN